MDPTSSSRAERPPPARDQRAQRQGPTTKAARKAVSFREPAERLLSAGSEHRFKAARKTGTSGPPQHSSFRSSYEVQRQPFSGEPSRGHPAVTKSTRSVAFADPANSPSRNDGRLGGVHKTARKATSSNFRRGPSSSFSYIAPSFQGIGRPTKSVRMPPTWLIRDDEVHKQRAAKKLSQMKVGGHSPGRMLSAMSIRRRTMEMGSLPGERVGHLSVAQNDHDEDRDEYNSRMEGGRPPRYMFATKAARKSVPQSMIVKSIRPFGHGTASKHAGLIGKAARKHKYAGSSADVIELSDSSAEEEDLSQLDAAFNSLALRDKRLAEHGRLPYLRRNLRVGFILACRELGIRTEPRTPPSADVTVVYRYHVDDDSDDEDGRGSSADQEDHRDNQEWSSTKMLSDWVCPLCELLGQFNTREMLQFHFERDHKEVTVSWVENTRGDLQSWRIEIIIRDPESDLSSSDFEDSDSHDSERAPSPTLESVHLHYEGEAPRQQSVSVEQEQLPRTPSAASPEDILIPKRSPGPPLPRFMKEIREASPTPTSTGTTYTERRSRSTTIWTSTSGQSYRGSLPARYPTPPPPSDPLGPAAQYPYLPPESENGEVYYSYRPGGPRIYDLLNTLPLEPFGVLSWVIVDREEELFEFDDVRDEDKVILALWNRWIMLNRTKFRFKGYLQGVLHFIDQYWQMIHRAAGWRALRGFLLMMAINRYLEISEVNKVLDHYESKTGMEFWYKEAESVASD